MSRRIFTVTAALAVAAHHGMELAGGIGVPGEPVLGRRRAVLVWGAFFPALVAAASAGGPRWDRALAVGNGALSALAAQHYLSWPRRSWHGVPLLTDAEGLPPRWLPAYNAALLTAITAATIGSLTDRGIARPWWHLLGLATLPVQHASARHHVAWLRGQGVSPEGGRRRGDSA